MWQLKKAYYRSFQKIMKYAMFIFDWSEPELLEGPGAVKRLPALIKSKGINKVLVVTDKGLMGLHLLDSLFATLDEAGVAYVVYDGTQPNPTIDNIEDARTLYITNNCEAVVAFGGGSPMDCAKGMWLYYEHPEVNFNDLKQKFMDIRKRAFRYPELGKKASLVCIPTTSGTGSEVTPFAVITDKETQIKYPLTDYSLTPTVAIIDPAFTMSLPASITANTGMDVLTHAVEAYVSVMATDFTDALALKAVQMVFEYLPRAVHNGAKDPEAREKMHNASCMAGMAFANAFLGMNHSMAHKIGAEFHVPHGLANAILLPYTIRYNGTKPEKPGIWPKYKYYNADLRYCELANAIGLKVDSLEQGVEAFAEAVRQLGEDCNITMRFNNLSYLNETDWMNAVEKLSYLAYEDQCSPANPRVPMVADMQEILRKSWTGEVIRYTQR